jgi:hypothetical protein
MINQTYVYLMGNFPFIWKSKLGITKDLNARVKNVSKTTKGKAFYLIQPARLPFGYECEQFVHGLYHFINAPFSRGSGRTEWFLNVNPITAGVVYYFFAAYLDTWQIAAIAFSPIVWLDGCLWIIIFSLLKIIIAITFMAILMYTLITWI